MTSITPLPFSPVSLQQMLDRHALQHAHKPAIVFLTDGKTIAGQISFAELKQRTRQLAAGLQAQGLQRGDRVLLLLESGIDYACAFLACLYVGLIAVPLFPPASRKPRHLQRLQRVIADAAPSLLLLSSTAMELADALPHAGAAAIPCATVEQLAIMAAASAHPQEAVHDAHAIAFLQYTSGSTGDPKGVIIRQRNLLANLELMRTAFELDEDDVWANWLPLYHDMGLIGSLLLPLYCGMSCYMTSPQTFARAPRTWLQIISGFGVTASFAPNFAFALCTRSIDDATLAELDLSRWTRALNGAEPIHKATVDAFCARFAAAGFRPEAMSPAYGQAEATLVVSATPLLAGPRHIRLQADALAQGRAVPATAGDPGALTFTACGLPQAGHSVRIVNPQTLRPCAADEIGELWLTGPSNAEAYWNKTDISRETCAARIEGDDGVYLRSGDLGFIHDGQLVICARLKDLIILNGRNIYPQDLEFALSEAGIGLRSGRVAAFAVNDEHSGREQLFLVAEPQQKHTQPHTHAGLFQAAQNLAYELIEHAIDRLLLVRPGSIPMTTSGKISRQGAKRQWLAGELSVIGDSAAPVALSNDAEPDEAARVLCGLVADILQVAKVNPQYSLLALGMDSVGMLTLQARLQALYGQAPALQALFAAPDIRSLAATLDFSRPDQQLDEQPADEQAAVQSFAQQGLWFMDRMHGGSQHNLLLRLHLRPQLDGGQLQLALNDAMARHDILRTCYRDTAHGAEQWVDPTLGFEWEQRSVADDSERTRVAERLRSRRFDLERGPMLRSSLLDLPDGSQEWLLAVHHIAFDARSAQILLADIAARYAGGELKPPQRSYRHFAQWQRSQLTAECLASKLEFWRGYLDVPDLVSLPSNEGHAGSGHDQHVLTVGAEPWQALQQLALDSQATPFMILLALFSLLLRQLSGQSRFIVGTDVLGRHHPEHQQTVGFFINQLPLRCALDETLSLDQWIASTRCSTQAAYAHQDLPFDQLVSGLKPQRVPGRSPLVQIKLNYRQQDLLDLQVGASTVTQVGVEQEPADYDLVLDVVHSPAGLDCTFEYRCAALRAERVHALASVWQRLLAEAPALRTSTLAEIALQLDRWQAGFESAALPPARHRLSHIARRPLTV